MKKKAPPLRVLIRTYVKLGLPHHMYPSAELYRQKSLNKIKF